MSNDANDDSVPKARDGAPQSLDEIRRTIDAIDGQLIALLNERAQCAIDVGKIKSKGDKPFFTPERERQIFEALTAKNPGPLRAEQLASVFREIISAARAAEQPLKVAYWGPPGAYSELAALQTFGSSADLAPKESIQAVFLSVENRECDYGVAPIENSIAGVVPETLDMFPMTNCKICAESYVQIRHCLASHAESLGEVRRVYAGPQPYAQCRRWLSERVPQAEIVEVTPTSLAAQKAALDPQSAAIVGERGAAVAGLPILAKGIEDSSKNETRFVVVGFNEPAPTGRDKTSVIFNLRNKPGELYRALGIFDANGVNLSMIESRPTPRSSFEYLFFCDFEGHRADERVQATLNALKKHALETIWLGSYPAAMLKS